MHDDEWKKVARLAGYVYIPIALLIVLIFVLVQYASSRKEAATTLVRVHDERSTSAETK
jgi:hypothetical protein